MSQFKNLNNFSVHLKNYSQEFNEYIVFCEQNRVPNLHWSGMGTFYGVKNSSPYTSHDKWGKHYKSLEELIKHQFSKQTYQIF